MPAVALRYSGSLSPASSVILRFGGCDVSPLFEIARVLVCFDHVASRIINANHGIL
jgi:hypothetical protein